ncbi:MAG: methyltransferase domain-containing protein [Candidatus Riflebacteria bacterium]|nr:methyltransferase domain-containing protein [Candidatus Riflebacteria bacterium]
MTMELEASSRHYWDRTWSRFLRHQGMIAPSSKLVQQMIPHLQRHARVLDLGCGEGRNTIYLSRVGFHGVGLDLSRKAVKMLANNLFEEEVRGQGMVGDARCLPFRTATFDGVLAHHLLDHLDGQGFAAAMAEVGRVLKPRGVLLLTMGNFVHLRDGREVTCRDDGSIVFTSGPNKGMLVRPYQDAALSDLGRQGWQVLKDELTPRGSKIMLLRRLEAAGTDVARS